MVVLSLYHHKQAPSSQTLAQQYLEATGECNFAVLVDNQTHGVGRLGRCWHSQTGNLSLSMVVQPPARLRSILPLVLAVMVLRALLALRPALAPRMSLKWPNDVLLDQHKVCGLLIQVFNTPSQYCIMGIGVNLLFAPDLRGDKAQAQPYLSTCLAAHVQPPSNRELAEAILEQWPKVLSQPSAMLLQEWQHHAHPVGTRLRIQHAGQYQEGEYLGLDTQGRLRLMTAKGEKVIVVGECFLSSPPDSAPAGCAS